MKATPSKTRRGVQRGLYLEGDLKGDGRLVESDLARLTYCPAVFLLFLAPAEESSSSELLLSLSEWLVSSLELLVSSDVLAAEVLRG